MSNEKRDTKKDDRSADEIERDLEGTREQLANDLEDLNRKVSPKNLRKQAMGTMDDAKEAAMDRVEDVANDFVNRAEDVGTRMVEGVREKPLPVALLLGALGAGYALLQARKGSGHSDRDASSGYNGSDHMRSGRSYEDRTGNTGDFGYDVGDNGEEENFIQKNGLLVGMGALAVGAVVGTLISISPTTMRKGREKLGEAADMIKEPFKSDSSSGGSSRGEGIQVRERIRVNKGTDELYRFWRNLENLPKVMSHLEEVNEKDRKRSHWKAKGPLNTSFEWDAMITDDRPNEMIAWRSVSDAGIPNEGSVKFRSVGSDSTDIIVSLTYRPPGGPIGANVAKLFGEEPSQQISDDLEKFKQEVESGRITLGSKTTGGILTSPTI